MAWIVLVAALQETPGRWQGITEGSWVDYRLILLRPDGEHPNRIYRDDAEPARRPRSFTQGLQELSRSPGKWKDLPCFVVEYAGGADSLTAWVVEGLSLPAREVGFVAIPADVVRALRVEKTPSTTTTTLLEVEDLHAKLELSGRAFDCVVETSSSVTEGASSRVLRSRRRWLSPDVPGQIVRQDRQCTAAPGAVAHAYTTRDELVDFYVGR